MKRCFSPMNAQQAPLVSRQAPAVGARQTADINAQSTKGGTSFHASQRTAIVASALGQLEKRFSRSHLTGGPP